MTDLEDARNGLHDAKPKGWFVGRPSCRDDLRAREPYAYVPAEGRRGVGHRAQEWTAVGQTELEVIREMARCLRVIGEGLVPKRRGGMEERGVR
jgi:hypothetical protein